MKRDIKEAIAWLETVSVRFRPKSMDTYDRVLALSEYFEALPVEDKEKISSEVTDDLSKKLLAFSGFFSEIALTTKDPKWIHGAIILHLMENVQQDCRENVRYLALIDYAASKIGAKFGELFVSVSAGAHLRVRKCIGDYLSTSKNPSDIGSFGIRVESKDGRFKFVSIVQ